MKKSNLKELLTKDGRLKFKFQRAYTELCYHVKFKDKKMYLKSYSGKGKYRRITDSHYKNMIEFLKLNEIMFDLGNDAPRGGQLGDYILIRSNRINPIIRLIEDSDKNDINNYLRMLEDKFNLYIKKVG